jgi:hypothetical protein
MFERHGDHLTHLAINSCGKISDAHLAAISSRAYRLRHLSLECNYGKMTPDAVIQTCHALNGTLESIRVVNSLVMREGGWTRLPFFDACQIDALMRETHLKSVLLTPSDENI